MKNDWKVRATAAILNLVHESNGVCFGSLSVAFGVPVKVVENEPGRVVRTVRQTFPSMLDCASERLAALFRSTSEDEFLKADAKIRAEFEGKLQTSAKQYREE